MKISADYYKKTSSIEKQYIKDMAKKGDMDWQEIKKRISASRKLKVKKFINKRLLQTIDNKHYVWTGSDMGSVFDARKPIWKKLV